MPEPVWLPRFDPSNEESRILHWLVREGERVLAGDPLCEVETDKVNMEIESPADGLMGPRRYPDDTVVPASTAIAWILKEEEQEQPLPPWPQGDGAPGAGSPRATTVTHASDNGPPARASADSGPLRTGRVRATPAARHLARVHRVELARLQGSGPRGRIQAADVRRSTVPSQPAAAVCLEMLVDQTEMNGLLQMWPVETAAAAPGALLLRACVLALGSHPKLNAVYRDGRFVSQDSVSPGLVLPLDSGQGEAVLHGADGLDMHSLLQRREDLLRRARDGALAAMERSGETIRICDMREAGIQRVVPRHCFPSAASLGVGGNAGQLSPCGMVEGQGRSVIVLSLVLAGGTGAPSESDGARFLNELCYWLERPLGLLLEGGTDAHRDRM